MTKHQGPDYEKLFLMEVFLDSVYISMASLDLDPTVKSKLKETCAMFQFQDYPPLVLCEQDFTKSPPPRESTGGDVNLTFKSGKSCMFSIPSSEVPTLPYTFKVEVLLLRKYEENGQMANMTLGKAAIELGDSVAALMHSSVVATDLPLAKTKQGTFDILDGRNKKIGAITGLVRVSCFGQLIVTQFQVGAKDAVMFKGTETKEIEEIPGDASKMPKIQVDPNYVPPPPPQPHEDQGPHGDGYDTALQPYCPTYEDMYPPYEPPEPVMPPEEPGNYKEIVAEIRGHSLHIRIPTKPKKEKEICKKQLMEDMEGPICKFAPPLNLCDCDYPVPPEAIPRCPPQCPMF